MKKSRLYILLGIIILVTIFLITYFAINTRAAEITASANEIENEKTLVKMMASHSKGNSADNKVNKDTLKNEFDRYLGTGKITITEQSSEKLLLAFVKTGNQYEINVNTGMFIPIEYYTITYDANGGTSAPESQEKPYGSEITLSSTVLTRTGYTFKGWATSNTATVPEYLAGASYSTEGNTTLYAVWSQNYLTVNYYSNYATEAFSGAPTVSASTNVLVRTVKFYYSTEYPDGLHNYSTTGAGTYLARTGYNATGNWGTTTSGGTQVGEGTSFASGQALAQALGKDLSSGNASINLYAQWSINTYTVSYNANGGSGAPASQTKTHGIALTLSSTKPTRTGYAFQGWGTSASATSATYQAGSSYTTNSGTTLYAVWKANTYSVKFNTNNGSGTMSNQSFTYDTAQNLTANAFTRTGYTFGSWNTKADGTGTTYANKASVKNLTSTSGGTVNLYAIWTANKYTVKFNANGGSGTMSDQGFTYGTAQNLRANAFTRTGYTFLGWSKSSTATSATYTNKQSVNNLTSTNNGTVTLYAVWEKTGDYEQLEYIQTTGTQYIDTDITVFNQSNFEIDFTAAFTAVNYNYNNMWGTTDGYEYAQGWVYESGKISYKWGDAFIGKSTVVDTSKHTYKFIKSGSTLTTYMDTTQTGTESDSHTYDKKMRLFSKNLSSFGKAKVYSIQIFVNNTLTYNLVPAKRISDGVLGLRDTINKKFYTNNGSGTFGAGAVVDIIE